MKFPPGVYYVGDPCYAIDDEIWTEFCERFNEYDDGSSYRGDKDLVNGGFLFEDFHGGDVWCCHTKYGDGTYEDDATGKEFMVDAGLIGVVPANLVHPDAHDDATLVHGVPNIRGGHIIKFDQEFTCSGDSVGSGEIQIGPIVIQTEDPPEEDPWDDDEWGDDEDDY